MMRKYSLDPISYSVTYVSKRRTLLRGRAYELDKRVFCPQFNYQDLQDVYANVPF